MESSKISTILCFVIASFLIRESQSTLGLLKKGLGSKRPVHKEFLLSPNQKQCVCFPVTQSGIPVSENISPNGEVQNRLVVYFYQKKGSNTFTVYIPNAKKQLLIPELTLDQDDMIEKNIRPKSFDLYKFIKYFQTIIVPRNQNPNIDTTTIYNHTKIIVENVPINHATPSENEIYIRPQDIIKQQTVKIITNPNGTPGNRTILIHPWETDQRPNNLNKSQHWLPNNNKIIENIINGQNGGKLTKPDKVPPKKPNGYLNLQIKRPNKSDNKGISPHHPDKEESIVILPANKNNNNNNIITTNESGTQDNKYINHPPLESITIIKPEWIDLTLPSNADLTLPSNAFIHPAFEHWFIKQIQNVRSTRPSIFNLLDTHTLRILLKKSLYNNGIRQNNAGKLYDSNGNYIDMAKLVLRPMFLGDSLDYEKIIASKKCVIPYDIPYLEALLVTLVDPPKVLAIIPLRKILISKSSNVIRSGGCKLSKCQTNKCLNYQTSIVDALHSADTSDKDEVTKYLKIQLSRRTEEDKDELEPREASNELVWRNDESEVESESSRNDNVVNHLESGDYLAERTLKDDTPQEITNKEEDEDLEPLGFRIVGGNPATSSGTPVSSKGRSGDEELDPLADSETNAIWE